MTKEQMRKEIEQLNEQGIFLHFSRIRQALDALNALSK